MGSPPLTADEQERLATALRAGEPGAFDRLYAALHPAVYNLACRVVGDRNEAEDITQEVFLAAYAHLPDHRGALRVEPWLFRVTMNRCYDHLRRRGAATPDAEAAAHLVDARDQFEQSQISSAVEATLRDLSPRYRAALMLKDVHGLDNRELAEVLGVSRGAVGVLLFRARHAFRRRYRELGPAGTAVGGLAGVLPVLPVPEALQVPPCLHVAPSGAAPAFAPVAPTAAAPLALVSKLTGAGAVKVVLVAAAVTAVTGGGMAAREAAQRDARPAPPPTAAAQVHTGDQPAAGDGGAAARGARRPAHDDPDTSSGDGAARQREGGGDRASTDWAANGGGNGAAAHGDGGGQSGDGGATRAHGADPPGAGSGDGAAGSGGQGTTQPSAGGSGAAAGAGDDGGTTGPSGSGTRAGAGATD